MRITGFYAIIIKIEAIAFESTTSLKCVDLSQTQVKIIDEEAFKDSSIEEIILPLTCKGKSMNIPAGIRVIYADPKRESSSPINQETIDLLKSKFKIIWKNVLCITIATSPYFLNQELAIDIINNLLYNIQ